MAESWVMSPKAPLEQARMHSAWLAAVRACAVCNSAVVFSCHTLPSNSQPLNF